MGDPDLPGRRPSAKTLIGLRQQATLATRPDKEVRSLADLTTDWRERAGKLLEAEATTWAQHVIADAGRPVLLRADDIPVEAIAQVAAAVVEQVGTKRSTWRHWNLHAEASRQTMELRFATDTDREHIVAAIVAAAAAGSLRLSPPELVNVPAVFRVLFGGDGLVGGQFAAEVDPAARPTAHRPATGRSLGPPAPDHRRSRRPPPHHP